MATKSSETRKKNSITAKKQTARKITDKDFETLKKTINKLDVRDLDPIYDTLKDRALELNRLRCIVCGSHKSESTNFYTSRNHYFKDMGRFPMCKVCIERLYNSDDSKTLYELFQIFNIPFIKTYWDGAILGKSDTLKQYINMCMSGMNNLRHADFLNSDFDVINGFKVSLEGIEEDFTTTKEMKKRWGSAYDDAEYEYLEDKYKTYQTARPTEDLIQKDLYYRLCKTELLADKLLAADNYKQYNDTLKVIEQMQKQGKINMAENTNTDKCLGVTIEQLEQVEPAVHLESIKQLEDVDKINVYFSEWVIKPLKKLFGVEA